MSAISSIGTNSSGSGKASSLNGMGASDFLNLMIQQLQQQDPLNPTDSNQLLSQMSQISSLQSNTELRTTLDSAALQQSIGSGGNLIGKTVKGLDDRGAPVDGIVTAVKVANKTVYLELDSNKTLPLKNVTNIAPTGASSLSSLAANLPNISQFTELASQNPQLQQLLSAGGGSNLSNLSSLASLLSSLGG